jgi:hypothetical protein
VVCAWSTLSILSNPIFCHNFKQIFTIVYNGTEGLLIVFFVCQDFFLKKDGRGYCTAGCILGYVAAGCTFPLGWLFLVLRHTRLPPPPRYYLALVGPPRFLAANHTAPRPS